MKVLKSPTSSPYCVPAALSAITGKHVDEICNLLTERYLGDVSISGIFPGIDLDLLRSFGYTVHDSSERFGSLSQIKKISEKFAQTYYVKFASHVGVVFDGKYYDNSNPNGVTDMPHYRLKACYLVTK